MNKTSSGTPTKHIHSRGRIWLFVGIATCLIAGVFADYWTALPIDAKASFVGREACIDCHRDEAELFHGSHHDLAMDLATDESVIGNFDNAELEHYGITSRMYRDGERFMIHTEGPDGQLHDYQIKYVFGVDPLQQYMVEFDRPGDMPSNEVARLQVLRVSWDTKEKKWFYLDPPDVHEKLEPDDILHWTGMAQRWNTMCAECHSTNLKKNFDDRAARYHTTWSEIDVSCEACHGPGSLHVKLANSKSLFWDRHHGYGLTNLKGPDPIAQIETCAPCHSRRRVLHADFRPGDRFCDFYEPELLHEGMYHANGEILDEVYVYGSFVQSKMYHKGIRCTDCHDPHSLKLKKPGNETCTSCHAHPAGKYDSPSHHHHEPGTAGALCVECHMPETTYMALDPRRDHSIRIPRPDLSIEVKSPNACTGCHVELERDKALRQVDQRFPTFASLLSAETDGGNLARGLKDYAGWLEQARSGSVPVNKVLREIDVWCNAACDTWYGAERKTKEHYGVALDAARRRQPDAIEKLAEVVTGDNEVPDIVKATAIEEMRRLVNDNFVAGIARDALQDDNPIIRAAALRVFEGRPASQVVRTVTPFLSDESRLVRSEAGRILSMVPADSLTAGQRQLMEIALDEYKAGLMTTNDRAGAHLAWSAILENQGRFEEAIDAYETAIRVQPDAVGARSNLATLLESMLQTNRVRPEEIAALRIRIQALRNEELPLLSRDAELAPNNGPLQYRLGLALYLNGQGDQGCKQLEKAVSLEPDNEQFLMALVLLLQKLNRTDEAKTRCQTLIQLAPDNPQYQAIMEQL